MTVWFTSDTHWGHHRILKYCNRPFETIEEMNEKLIENWNKVVKRGDLVYHLGDIAMRMKHDEFVSLFKRLNGMKKLVLGNHDKHLHKNTLSECFVKVDKIMEETIAGKRVVMCHYPLRSWDGQFYGAINLHGHTHGTLNNFPYKDSVDVGVDSWNYTPCNIDQIMALLESRKNHTES